jgi:hypothetical protein
MLLSVSNKKGKVRQ